MVNDVLQVSPGVSLATSSDSRTAVPPPVQPTSKFSAENQFSTDSESRKSSNGVEEGSRLINQEQRSDMASTNKPLLPTEPEREHPTPASQRQSLVSSEEHRGRRENDLQEIGGLTDSRQSRSPMQTTKVVTESQQASPSASTPHPEPAATTASPNSAHNAEAPPATASQDSMSSGPMSRLLPQYISNQVPEHASGIQALSKESSSVVAQADQPRSQVTNQASGVSTPARNSADADSSSEERGSPLRHSDDRPETLRDKPSNSQEAPGQSDSSNVTPMQAGPVPISQHQAPESQASADQTQRAPDQDNDASDVRQSYQGPRKETSQQPPRAQPTLSSANPSGEKHIEPSAPSQTQTQTQTVAQPHNSAEQVDQKNPMVRRTMLIAPAPAPLSRNSAHSPGLISTSFVTETPSPAPESQRRLSGETQECSNCKTTKTPLWRRGPNGQNLCNACGLYVKARNINRPVTLKRSPVTRSVPLQMGSCPGDGRCNGTGGSESCPQCPSFNNNRLLQDQQTHNSSTVNMVSCQNCGTVTTPLWRRDAQGHIICNACGLYNRIHKDSRPSDMRASVIKRRRRNTNSSSDSSAERRRAVAPHGSQSPSDNSTHKLSQPPSPSPSIHHSHTSPHPDQLCCTHMSPALQGTQQYAAPVYGSQVPQGVPGAPAPAPPQHPEAQKTSDVPYSLLPMNQGGHMGLSVMLPPPPQAYVGHSWPLQPQMGAHYPYPHGIGLPGHAPPGLPLQPQAGGHGGWPQPIPQQPHQEAGIVQQSKSPQETPQVTPVPNQTHSPQFSPYQQAQFPQGQSQKQTRVPDQHPETRPKQSAQASDASPLPEELSDQKDKSTKVPKSQSTSQTKATMDKSDAVVTMLNRRRPSDADTNESPLSVLHYLQGASKDTINEYLLAAQRQLNDKVSQLQRQLGRAEFQLKECEDALEKINQDGRV